MKAFVAVALAAAAQAAPEADPQVLLAQPLVYGNAHTQVHAQVKHANGAVVPDDTLSVKAAKVQHLAAKATAYLNKPLVYTHPVVQTVAAPLVHQTVASPVVSYTGAYPHVYGTHFIKREAEAEAEAQPEAEADPALLVHPYTAGVVPHVYNGVYGAHVTAPVTYTHGLTTPVVSTVAKTVVPTTVVKPVVSSPIVSYTGLTHHVPYVAKTVVPTTVVKPVVGSVYNYGLHTPVVGTHLIKREAEAEAEADPAYFYNGYTGVSPYTHTAYTGYTGLHSAYSPVYGYNNVYGYHYGKREAGAEAEADPEAYYATYGYHAAVPRYTGYTGAYTTGHAVNYAYNPVYGYNNYAGYNGYAYGK